jgi:hypothetical protein
MNELEETVRVQWKADATHIYRGRCDHCGRTYDDDGRPLIVARQPRRRDRECLACYDERISR